MIQNGTFSIVLMDLRMPGMDGLTAIRLLRGRGDGKSTLPVIVVTADTAVDLRERCIASGADDVIMKPIAMGALLESMGRMIARSADVVLS
jgi:CheY-like chemotaxis protein